MCSCDKRLEKGKLTKERIISAAMEIISTEGIEGLSGAKLAKKSGMPLHSFFTSEDDAEKWLLE